MPEAAPRRLVQITDVDDEGRRLPVLVTSDPYVVAATERAIRERVGQLGTGSGGGMPGQASA